ncbi:hypothetical protein D5S17_23400 [Pseudonocardiaceae bacterium YIM PH 21723]|nr:hypothetical protein D5S17_23400 [Pseudonocardiaceae bacterium YIM PH 21723]
MAGRKWQPPWPTRYEIGDQWPADRVHLTEAEAPTLTPDEFTDRYEFEVLWWERRTALGKMTEQDEQAYRRFRLLLPKYLPLEAGLDAGVALARGDTAAHSDYLTTPIGQRLTRSQDPDPL